MNLQFVINASIFPGILLIRNFELFFPVKTNEPFTSSRQKERTKKSNAKRERGTNRLPLNKLAKLRAAVRAKVFSLFLCSDFTWPPRFKRIY